MRPFLLFLLVRGGLGTAATPAATSKEAFEKQEVEKKETEATKPDPRVHSPCDLDQSDDDDKMTSFYRRGILRPQFVRPNRTEGAVAQTEKAESAAAK